MSAGLRIVGQGLAGTVLAWRCLQAGVSFEILDQDRPVTASKVAAGLVTPVTGQRMALTLGWEWQPDMLAFYQWVEDQLGEQFYLEREMVRVLADVQEHLVYQRRLADPGYANVLTSNPGALDNDVMPAPLGSFTLRGAGVLRVHDFLKASRQHFKALGCWIPTPENWIEDVDRITVLCQGPWLFDQARFDWLPMRYSHGDILTLSIPALDAVPGFRDRLYTRHCWLVPDGDDRWRAGSTYVGMGMPETKPSMQGRAHLEDQLRDWLACDYEVIDHVAAVRPVTFTRHPVLGRHPAHPHLAVFGGLGSKGVLTAPHYARVLLAHLYEGAELPREVDIAVQ